jgi:hypothetical protein
MTTENAAFDGSMAPQSGETPLLDLDFEKKRLVRALEDAATALPEDELKEALSQGLGNTHLTVVEEPEEPMSVLLDTDGKPKRGLRSHMTREEVIQAVLRSKKQKRVAKALSRLQPGALDGNTTGSDKSDDTL